MAKAFLQFCLFLISVGGTTPTPIHSLIKRESFQRHPRHDPTALYPSITTYVQWLYLVILPCISLPSLLL